MIPEDNPHCERVKELEKLLKDERALAHAFERERKSSKRQAFVNQWIKELDKLLADDRLAQRLTCRLPYDYDKADKRSRFLIRWNIFCPPLGYIYLDLVGKANGTMDSYEMDRWELVCVPPRPSLVKVVRPYKENQLQGNLWPREGLGVLIHCKHFEIEKVLHPELGLCKEMLQEAKMRLSKKLT